MVPPIDKVDGNRSSICDLKMSTVVPGSITGEDKTHQFGSLDLAMKLHYVTTVHFFGADAVEGLGIHDFKLPMFYWLQAYYPLCGRIRRLDGGGRPFIKCNDSGVRIVEAKCTKTVAEWLETAGTSDHHQLLVYHQPVLAHDFGFTPLVLLQLTQFKCGGVSIGMRWLHVLGDAFSATECINTWGRIMATQAVPCLDFANAPIRNCHSGMSSSSSCRSLKLLEPLGDNWLTPNNSKLQTHTFHLTEKHLTDIQSHKDQNRYDNQVKPFELISAVVWKSLAKIRGEDAKIVTICKKGSSGGTSLRNELLGNVGLVIGTVEAETVSMVTDGDPVDLAKMIDEKLVDETGMIERQIEEGNGNVDCIVFGSNLTFIDLEGVNLRGLEINGRPPAYADVCIGGVGDGGAVVIAPCPGQEKGGGRIVNVSLPVDQVHHLKDEMGHFMRT